MGSVNYTFPLPFLSKLRERSKPPLKKNSIPHSSVLLFRQSPQMPHSSAGGDQVLTWQGSVHFIPNSSEKERERLSRMWWPQPVQLFASVCSKPVVPFQAMVLGVDQRMSESEHSTPGEGVLPGNSATQSTIAMGGNVNSRAVGVTDALPPYQQFTVGSVTFWS